MSLYAIFCPGPAELAIIAVIALLLLGPTMLPKAARSLGSVIPSLRAGFQDAKREIDETSQELNKVVNDKKTT